MHYNLSGISIKFMNILLSKKIYDKIARSKTNNNIRKASVARQSFNHIYVILNFYYTLKKSCLVSIVITYYFSFFLHQYKQGDLI